MTLALPPLPTYRSLETTDFSDLLDTLTKDAAVMPQTDEDVCQLDPRDGSMIIYAEHRARRPNEHEKAAEPKQHNCPICAGNLTEVIDQAPLSEGFSFITQNMFPVLYPTAHSPDLHIKEPLYDDPNHHGRSAFGLHLLQWTSSIHDNDWHNMPVSDLMINMQRLAALEDKLLFTNEDYMPVSCEIEGARGYLTIIKNFGPEAGASLNHGHQQIAYSNIMPQRTYNNARFYDRHQYSFSQYMHEQNPASLTIAEIGCAKIVVPYYMRRPFNLMVLLNTRKNYLCHQQDAALFDLTCAMQKVIRIYHKLMPMMGKAVSYNMAIHTGPRCELYVEFFPAVQVLGGYERIGLWISQMKPQTVADRSREVFETLD